MWWTRKRTWRGTSLLMISASSSHITTQPNLILMISKRAPISTCWVLHQSDTVTFETCTMIAINNVFSICVFLFWELSRYHFYTITYIPYFNVYILFVKYWKKMIINIVVMSISGLHLATCVIHYLYITFVHGIFDLRINISDLF